MAINYTVAVEYIAESLMYETDTVDNESFALDRALELLSEYIVSGLTYHSDILALWDMSTHDNVELGNYDSLIDAITASVYHQLMEDWADAICDGVDEWIKRTLKPEYIHDYSRDDSIEYIHAPYVARYSDGTAESYATELIRAENIAIMAAQGVTATLAYARLSLP